jgi:two-component system, OmpR family, response regulator RstA
MDQRKSPKFLELLAGSTELASPPGNRGLILYVSDNLKRANLEGIACLQDAGFRVWQMDVDSYAAVDMLLDDACSLVLFDIGGPGDIGFRLCIRLRAQWPGPIFIILREPAHFKTVRAIEAGCDMYIFEPYDKAELVARVNALLRRSERSRD